MTLEIVGYYWDGSNQLDHLSKTKWFYGHEKK
jgi:hypothetical protein